MDWIKRNIRGIWPFLFIGAALGALIAMSAFDTIKLKECRAQSVELQQELTMVREQLQGYREMAKKPPMQR